MRATKGYTADRGSASTGVIRLPWLEAGEPTLPVRVLEHVQCFRRSVWSRSELADHLQVVPVRIGQALKTLCERGYADRVAHGRYVFTERGVEGCAQ